MLHQPPQQRREDDNKHEQCRLPLPPPPLYLPLPLSFSFIATAIRIRPPSLTIILLGYAMHIPPTETNWCWRPTVTLLSLAVDVDLFCHGDCLLLPLPRYRRLLHGILQLFLLFWNITCQTRLIQGRAHSNLDQRRLGVTETLSTNPTDIIMHSVGMGASMMGTMLF